jgi:hypothetical protein
MKQSKIIDEINQRHPRWEPFTEPGKCKGCGIAETKGDWAPGHDAKAKRSSQLADPDTLVGPVNLCGGGNIDVSSGAASRSKDASKAKGDYSGEMTADSSGSQSNGSTKTHNCIPFDDIVMVDWSANTTHKTGENSIWIAHLQINTSSSPPGTLELHNPKTRQEAYELLTRIINSSDGRRVLIGLDFAFGLPSCANSSAMECLWNAINADPRHKHSLGSSYCARDIWSFSNKQLFDVQDTKKSWNNHLLLAETMNRLLWLGGWDCCNGVFYITDEMFKLCTRSFPKRMTEACCNEMMGSTGAMPVWQLDRRGAVGSQTLMGWPTLSRLCQMNDVEVWPFDTKWNSPTKRVVIVEIFPSLITKCTGVFGELERNPVSSSTPPGSTRSHKWNSSVVPPSTSMPPTVDITAINGANPWNGSSELITDAYQVASCALAVWDKQVSGGGLDEWFTLSGRSSRPTVHDDEGWILGALGAL